MMRLKANTQKESSLNDGNFLELNEFSNLFLFAFVGVGGGGVRKKKCDMVPNK